MTNLARHYFYRNSVKCYLLSRLFEFFHPSFFLCPLARTHQIDSMHRMVFRWRRSGLHCAPPRSLGERTPNALSQASTDPAIAQPSVRYSQLPISRTSVPSFRTPLRELDVGMLDGVQQVTRARTSVNLQPYPATFTTDWPVTFGHSAKSFFSTTRTDNARSALGMSTSSHYTLTTSSPFTPNRLQSSNRITPVRSTNPVSGDWASA